MNIKKFNIRGTAFMFGWFRPCNNLNNKNIFISEFHSSVCLLSDKNKDLEKRIENLNINNDGDIRLSNTEVESLRKGLSELKTKFSESDVLEEHSKLQKYVENNPTIMSSFEEAFP